MKLRRLLAACIFILFASAPRVHAQEPLAAARELYASAEYENALRLLDGLPARNYTREERQTIDLYRALCLLAVGSRADAEHTIETMFAEDPLYRPSDDLSPRMRSAFSDTKKRVLPAIVQQHYGEAKAAFDRKDFADAASGFKQVLDALNDPDMGEAATQSPLSDLRTLAAGFHDLSKNAIPPPPAAAPVAPPAPLPAKVYTGNEPDVTAPITIRQELPHFNSAVRQGGIKGVLEVVINEEGGVESTSMPVSTQTSYDKIVQTAASGWLYYPATVNRTPVKFRKRIQITIAAANAP